jgi:tetratricopeptide (TPR) repeat protein
LTKERRGPYLRVLISHASEEKALAEAWKSLITTTSSGAVEVWFSSDVAPTGGMAIGKEWRNQLYARLDGSDFVIAIQTPTSAGRPWIMWECGVASGVDKVRGVIPITFSMGRGDLGNPLNTYQVYQGEAEQQVREICARLAREAGLDPPTVVYDEAIKAYVEQIKLHQARPAIRAEQMTLWSARFEQLIRSGRAGEVPSKRSAMYASFGDSFEPVDPVLHELLSRTLLLDNKEYEAAITEVDYALRIVGDDVDLLHRKALALAEMHDLPAAEAIVGELLSSNAQLAANPELASLEGRIHRERWLATGEQSHLDKAYSAYLRAYEADRTQYYPGINAGSLALTKGYEEKAKEIFGEVLSRCDDLQRRVPVSYWVDFSAGEAHLGLGETEEAIADYRRGVARTPTPPARDKASAVKGVRRMALAKELDNNVVREIERVLS